jgi:hypothetical protein
MACRASGSDANRDAGLQAQIELGLLRIKAGEGANEHAHTCRPTFRTASPP